MHRSAADRRLLAAGLASGAMLLWTVPHTIEDFLAHVPEHRFGLSQQFALWGSGPLFATQIVALVLVLAGWRRWGLWLLLLDSAGWAVAALLDHVGEIIQQPFRAGFSSTVWVVGIVLNGLVAALCAWRALRAAPGVDS